MSQSFHLYQLQKIDSQIDQNNHRIGETEKIIEDDSQSKNMQAIRVESQKQFSLLSMDMKKLEDEIEQQKIKIEHSNNSLFSGKITNPKELQDLQNEVASLKKNIGNLEEEQLQKLIVFESAEKDLKEFDDKLTQFQADHITRISSLRGEVSRIKLHNQNLVKERAIILGQINKDALSVYEQLRQKKKGIAVSEILESVCSACGSELTPAECQKARSPETVAFCSSCGRILYAT